MNSMAIEFSEAKKAHLQRLVGERRFRKSFAGQQCDQRVEAEVGHLRADDPALVLQLQIDHLGRLTVGRFVVARLAVGHRLLASDLLVLAEILTELLSGHDRSTKDRSN